MALNSAQFLSPQYNPKAGDTYPFDQNCAASVDTTSADNYYVTLARVSLVCDERDFLEVKSPSSSDVPVYRFCGETLDTQFEDFSFCWSSNIEDSVEMTILFKSGDDQMIENRRNFRGIDLSFKATETSGKLKKKFEPSIHIFASGMMGLGSNLQLTLEIPEPLLKSSH